MAKAIEVQTRKSVDDAIRVVEQLKTPEHLYFIKEAAALIASCFASGNKVLIAGNGGSLCDAAHFAEELTGVFRKPRRALPVLVCADPGHLSCVANDLGYEWVFARYVEAFGVPGDIFIALSTSGNSINVIRATEVAKEKGLKTIAFLGKSGGVMKGIADRELWITGFETADRIQEAHMTALHIIIELVEMHLFSNQPLSCTTYAASSV